MSTIDTQSVGISERIKLARKKLGISGDKVPSAPGLSRSICSQWERGISNPSTAHLGKLAKSFTRGVICVASNWG
ncbi:helix-turn-helix domain-containing protein [Isorropodon fossajaponicum symbiont]|uniref:helix-turn-helix domain-containing protein n=1 Tax=Isorropodon fossajaponicum symbiont TaxID=883811 RepID=UPI001916784D|nr:helix-turn-helix transcriptional regulator [Isorropodon fossajaponicum symbiont]